MSCSLFDSKDLEKLETGMLINHFTFFDSKATKLCAARVCDIVKLVPTNPIIIIEISEIYEQN